MGGLARPGQRLGMIVQHKLRAAGCRSTRPSHRTLAQGSRYALELNTDRDERVRAVMQFADDPDQFRQHWS